MRTARLLDFASDGPHPTVTVRATSLDGSFIDHQFAVSLSLIQPPTAPVSLGDSYTGRAGQVINVDDPGVLKNDFDAEGNQLISQLVRDARNGALVLEENGRFTYLPRPGFVGSDQFAYQVSDGTDLGNTVVVELEIIVGAENGPFLSGVAIDQDEGSLPTNEQNSEADTESNPQISLLVVQDTAVSADPFEPTGQGDAAIQSNADRQPSIQQSHSQQPGATLVAAIPEKPHDEQSTDRGTLAFSVGE